MKCVACIFALFIASQLGAQNYTAFLSGSPRLYTAGDGSIGLEVAEASFDGDSIFTLSWNWIFDEFEQCHIPSGPAWLGRELRVAPNGDHTFTTGNDELVLIRSQADLGEQWLAYSSVDAQFHVQAEVSAWEVTDVFSASEMVKTISLQALDQDMQPVSSFLNTRYFQFAENLGLVACPSLRGFPLYQNGEGAEMFEITGIEDVAGLQNLTWLEVFNFQANDEFLIEQGTTTFGVANITATQRTILTRTDYLPDSITYSIRDIRHTYNGPLFEYFPTLLDTLIYNQTYRKNAGFDAMPGSPFELTSEVWLSTRMNQNPLGRFKYYDESLVYTPDLEDGTDCFFEFIDYGCFSGDFPGFLEGLGGPYIYCSQGAASAYWTQLLYANTSTVLFGEPLSVRDGDDADALISLYPNPTKGVFSISSPTNLLIRQVRIFDVSGRLMLSIAANDVSAQLDLSAFETGIYLALVSLSDGRSFSKRVVKD